MLFNSFTFILFFAVILLLHYSPLSWRINKLSLLVGSYLFYAAWNPPFVALLWVSTVIDWFASKWMARTDNRRRRIGLLLVSLFTNLGLLSFFKYGNFLLQNIQQLMSLVDIDFQPLKLSVVLPVGISFYTFQTLSYTIDVYCGRIAPARSFLDFALYVTFFPQLVAGPIVRAADFIPLCAKRRRATRSQLGWGAFLFILGLFQKTVLADAIFAPVVELVYDTDLVPSFISAWCGTLAFAGQIFCDFAGYSTCAIGIALCLGFALPDNFRFPYAAIGFSDFWRRWHISLSTWLRDYLYIPLGGSRNGARRTYINLMLTMLIGGLWHGASWTFVVWGGLHGIYLVAERIFARSRLARLACWNSSLGRLTLAAGTFALVCVTWAFFRADNFPKAFTMTAAMFGWVSSTATLQISRTDLLFTLSAMALILALHWRLREMHLESFLERLPWWVLSCLTAIMLTSITLMPGEDRAFIYFQF